MGLCGNCKVLKDQAETALAAAEVTFQPLCQEDPESSVWDPNADTIKNSNTTLTSFTGWTKIQSNKMKEHSGSLWQSSPSVDSRWAEQARNQIYTYRHKQTQEIRKTSDAHQDDETGTSSVMEHGEVASCLLCVQ